MDTEERYRSFLSKEGVEAYKALDRCQHWIILSLVICGVAGFSFFGWMFVHIILYNKVPAWLL